MRIYPESIKLVLDENEADEDAYKRMSAKLLEMIEEANRE